jgi:hypothetical protein
VGCERSNQNHSGKLTRKPSTPTRFANQRTAWSFFLNAGTTSRIAAPRSGV